MPSNGFNLRAWGPEYLEGDGWEMEWLGEAQVGRMLEASRRAIDELNAEAYAIALIHEDWDNQTGQTEAAVFWERAEWDEAQHQMWGVWGVEDRPRFNDRGEYESDRAGEILSTRDVAFFLEFGTIRMSPRPWLYPAYDATKYRLPGTVRKWFDALAGVVPQAQGIRSPFGRFTRRIRF